MNTITQQALADAARQRRNPHIRLAQAQSAMHYTRVAIARWCSGHSLSELLAAEALMPTPQSRWHAAVQRDFCAWLDAGGFSRIEDDADTDGGGDLLQAELNCLHCE